MDLLAVHVNTHLVGSCDQIWVNLHLILVDAFFIILQIFFFLFRFFLAFYIILVVVHLITVLVEATGPSSSQLLPHLCLMTICQNSGDFICNLVFFVAFKAVNNLLLHSSEVAIESIIVDFLGCGYRIFQIDRNFFLTF